MTEGQTSYRDIFRSTSLIGGASLLNVLISLIRAKAVAVLLGPTGVGLMGLLTSVQSTAATVGGLGLASIGTRQIAESTKAEDQSALPVAWRALRTATLSLGLATALVVWLLRDQIAALVLDRATDGRAVGWISVGIAFSIAASAQTALLNGLRRIGRLAALSVAAGLASTIFGVAALWFGGPQAMIAFVILGPVTSFVLGFVFSFRVLQPVHLRLRYAALFGQWRALLRQGIPFTVAGLAGTGALLVVRSFLQHRGGLEASGFFQSSWMIAETYIGFVLAAMGADFLPRLTGVIRDKEAATRVVNEQAEVALLLSAPAVLMMLALAPWVLTVLYSPAFADSGWTLRWQVFASVFKLASWPVGFILIAASQAKTFMFVEVVAYAAFCGISVAVVPYLGVVATGLALVGMYALLLVMVHIGARRSIGFRWTGRVMASGAILASASAAVMLLSWWNELLGAAVGTGTAVLSGLYAIGRIAEVTTLSGPLGKLLLFLRRLSPSTANEVTSAEQDPPERRSGGGDKER